MLSTCKNGHELTNNVYEYSSGQIVCKPCTLERKFNQRQNKEVRDRIYEANRKWRSKPENKLKVLSNRQLVLAYIKDCRTKCIKCGEDHKACLDFHHRNPKDKKFGINVSLVGNRSLESVQEEIKKCDVLCSNCHRKAHYKGDK